MDDVVQVDLAAGLVIPMDEEVGTDVRHPDVVEEVLLVDDTVGDLGGDVAGDGGHEDS